MSKSSYVTVRFVGGPRSGESTEEFRGEPPRHFAPKGTLGTYRLEWDRDDNGARLRSGVYHWQEPAGDGLAEPRDGDEASALLALAGEHYTNKDGASISPVPDVTAAGAKSEVERVAADQAALEAEAQGSRPSQPSTRDDQGQASAPKSGDAASKVTETKPSTRARTGK